MLNGKKLERSYRMKTSDLTHIALSTAFLCVCAQISLPLPFFPVPFTLQVFAIFFLSILLLPRQSFIAVLIYVVLGALGLPVFAGGSSGIGILLGKTGGFLLSFPFCAYLVSWTHRRFNKYGYWVGVIIGLSLTYIAGTLQLSFITKTPIGAIVWGMLPLALMDLIKAVVAFTVASPITRILKQLVPTFTERRAG